MGDDKNHGNKTEEEIAKNISIAKGFSTSPMRLNNINRVQWVHRAALHQIGIDPDSYFYKLSQPKIAENDENKKNEKEKEEIIKKKENDEKSEEKSDDKLEDGFYRSFNGRIYSENELLNVMQTALCSENDDIIGRPQKFHLRNGDLIVWTDITWKPNKNQIEQKQKLEKEEAKKRGKMQKNPNFKGTKTSTFLSKFRKNDGASLKIRTYEEFLEDEKKKKEKEEKEQKENKAKEDKEGNGVKTEKQDLSEKAKLFNAMVAEEVNDIKNPKQMTRNSSI